MEKDTIVALATAPGNSGLAVIRLSGKQSKAIAAKIIKKDEKDLEPRKAMFVNCFDKHNRLVDEAINIYFQAPFSFTGEDVVEIQCHGSPVVIDMIIREACVQGARMARPGEFSERAFLNGKIDLVQAEAIADLISAQSETAARNALSSLKGEFSKKINDLCILMEETRCYLEAAIDFPDEEGVDFISEGQIVEKVNNLYEELEKILSLASQGAVFQEGIKVVLAGEPNAGKSSLLNCLAKNDRAIVSNVAGTTRDVLAETITLKGLPLKIIDTAGLRKSVELVEKEGIRRAWVEIESANILFYMFTSKDKQPFWEQEPWKMLVEKKGLESLSKNTYLLENKIDLINQGPQVKKTKVDAFSFTHVCISAKNNSGTDLLEEKLFEDLGIKQDSESVFAARRRHLESIEEAKHYLESAQTQLNNSEDSGELVAEDLRLAHRSLGGITGEFSADDLLGKIFSSFCIGK